MFRFVGLGPSEVVRIVSCIQLTAYIKKEKVLFYHTVIMKWPRLIISLLLDYELNDLLRF